MTTNEKPYSHYEGTINQRGEGDSFSTLEEAIERAKVRAHEAFRMGLLSFKCHVVLRDGGECLYTAKAADHAATTATPQIETATINQ